RLARAYLAKYSSVAGLNSLHLEHCNIGTSTLGTYSCLSPINLLHPLQEEQKPFFLFLRTKKCSVVAGFHCLHLEHCMLPSASQGLDLLRVPPFVWLHSLHLALIPSGLFLCAWKYSTVARFHRFQPLHFFFWVESGIVSMIYLLIRCIQLLGFSNTARAPHYFPIIIPQ